MKEPLDPIEIESITVVYSQDQDHAAEDRDSTQQIEISTCDAGAGPYLVIKTERWAIDTPEEIMRVLDDFKKRSENRII